MESDATPIELLLSRVEQHNKTTFELLKLKSVAKSADVASTLISRLAVIVALSFFALLFTIGISFWLGDILGKSYYGFLIVAFVYGLTGIILILLQPTIKAHMNNSIITQMLN
jgi:hypothetical protein